MPVPGSRPHEIARFHRLPAPSNERFPSQCAPRGKARIITIKAKVRDRDGGCVVCGMTKEEHFAKFGIDLDVHRIIPGSVYTIKGCVTLCKDCTTRCMARRLAVSLLV